MQQSVCLSLKIWKSPVFKYTDIYTGWGKLAGYLVRKGFHKWEVGSYREEAEVERVAVAGTERLDGACPVLSKPLLGKGIPWSVSLELACKLACSQPVHVCVLTATLNLLKKKKKCHRSTLSKTRTWWELMGKEGDEGRTDLVRNKEL